MPIASPDHPVKTYSLFGVALRVTEVPFLNVPFEGKTEPPSGGFTLISVSYTHLTLPTICSV